MGADFYFDEKLPVSVNEVTKEADWRQLELFAHGGKLYLRMGAVGKEDSPYDRYTVELPPAAAQDLAEALRMLTQA